MIDCEVLITRVFEHNPIWDKRLNSHSNRVIVKKCWKDISANMMVKEKLLRKKWKYLRDQFVTEHAKMTASGCKQEKSNCIYLPMLYFLKDVIEHRKACGNLTHLKREQANFDVSSIEMQISDNCSGMENAETEEQPIANIDATYSSTDDCTQSSDDKKVPHENKRKWTDDSAASLQQSDNEKAKPDAERTRSAASSDNDDDALFFRSLLPYVKKIRPQEVMTFRSRIQEIVQQFAYPITVASVQSQQSSMCQKIS